MTGLFMAIGAYLVDISAILQGDILESCRLVLFLISGFIAVTLSGYDILYMEIPDEVLLPWIFVLF